MIIEEDPAVLAPKRNTSVSFQMQILITQEALQAMKFDVMTHRPSSFSLINMKHPLYNNLNPRHYCAPVIHPTTGEIITKYSKLANEPETREVWTTAFGKEFGSIAQGENITGAKGTDILFILTHQDIRDIPTDRVVTYGRLVVNFLPQKEDPNRVQLTVGGNLITYPGDVTIRTADLTTSKILWNSLLSTSLEKYMCINIKNFYPCKPIDRYEHTRMKSTDFPEHVQHQYNLQAHAKNIYIYLEIRRYIYGLPQAGKLTNKYLQ